MQCKNCKNVLSESHRYCEDCGAKVIKNRLTPKVLAKQINNEFISIDNRFLKTFIDLFKKPEAVIESYIEGTRKRYIDVLQYFAVGLTLTGLQVFIMTTFYPEMLDFDMNFLMSEEMKSAQKDNPFVSLRLGETNNYQSLLYIVSVPFSAFATWIIYTMFGEKRYNFTEHLVLNLYYSGQVIIVSAVLSMLLMLFGFSYVTLSSIVGLLTFLYLFFVLKRLFDDNFLMSLAKFILIMILQVLAFVIAVILFVLITKFLKG